MGKVKDMPVIVTQYGVTVLSSSRMTILPRIGESMRINKDCYEIKDIIWHVENNGNIYIEIKIK